MIIDCALIAKGLPMQIENRLFKRYQVPDDVLYIYCQDSSVKGWVRDISSDGLGIGYFSVGNGRPKPELKLILAGNKVSVYLPDIACKIVYDRAVGKREGRFRGAVARQCGVQFGKLDAETRKKLQGIMTNRQPVENKQNKK